MPVKTIRGKKIRNSLHMVSLFGILNIGNQGIHTAQAGLNTTGQNVANANTEGYSRQRIIQQATNPLVTSEGVFGQGVDIIDVERLRDMFLEGQIRGAKSDTAFNEELSNIFLRIESILNDPLAPISETADQSSTGGINNLLSRFFQEFHQLSVNPESPEIRTAAVENALSLSETINTISDQLKVLREDLNESVSLQVDEINRMAEEVATLNHRIMLTESGQKVNANDLRDRRDKLLSDLSEMIPVTTEEEPNGAISVAVAGYRLVDGVNHTDMKLEEVKKSGNIRITQIRVGDKGVYTLDDKITKGRLGAALDARDRLVPFLQDEIDSLARAIIFEVNKIHSGATGIEGYTSIKSHFDIPEGAFSPVTNKTLDKLFNHPTLAQDAAAADQPFPIQDGAFSIRVANADNDTINTYDVPINTTDNLYDIVNRIDRSDGVVSQAQSAFSFDPVYVNKVVAEQGAEESELNQGLGDLNVAQGFPIAESAGTYTFELHLKDRAINPIDSDPATNGAQPFEVSFSDTDTIEELAAAIQSATDGRIRANLVPSQSDPDARVLKLEAKDPEVSFSIQNDTSGLFRAFEFPMTDPNTPLIGGDVTQAVTSFEGQPTDSFMGSGNPPFSPAFPGPPPGVVREGNFELVLIDNNNMPTIHTISISPTEVSSIQDLADAIEAVDSHLNVDVGSDGEFEITSSDHRSFFFQNDTSGLIKAMGFDEIKGHGKIGDQPFTEGSFEFVVTNESGVVSNIFEVPISADPSVVGGVLSMQDIVDQINRASDGAGAPILASIAKDPKNPGQNKLQIDVVRGFEFTFRSDDSLLLSALGFTEGAILNQTDDAPIQAADSTIAVGDKLEGMVRARSNKNIDFEIFTSQNEQISFTGDTSHFLAASGINGLFRGTDGRSMEVNNDILENINLLAASSNGNVGNNEAALALASLENQEVLQGQTLGEAYRSTVSSLGIEGQRVNQFFQTNEKILRELETLQEQNSGVSLDEESINIIRFQQAFQASARVITTVDRLLDLVVNQLGA